MPSPANNPDNQNNTNSETALTPEDIKKLTTELSSEIDQEIKKQLAEPHYSFSDTQTKIDQAVAQAAEAKQKPEPPKLNQPSTNSEPKKTAASVPEPETEGDLANLDPLQASVNSAISALKEGDQIGDGWTLKKIYSTSFGHNRSSFYELENSAGAKWTLSPEEMKDLLKSNVQGKQEPANLAPPSQNPDQEKHVLPTQTEEKK